MFIRKATRKYKGRAYTNYQLVRSVQTPKGPRQKLICSLGDLSPRPPEAWRQLAHQVEDALHGQPGLFEGSREPEVEQIVRQVQGRQGGHLVPVVGRRGDANEDLIAIHADRVRVEYASEAGPVHVGYQFWKRLGLDEILRGLEFSEETIQLTCAMALNRLIYPASEHAMPRWIRSTALEDMWDVDFKTLCDDRLYRNLDRLYPNRAAIEAALVRRERSLFNLQPTVFFYDLTSTYFEGQALANAKAKRGYSRDHRADCKQVVVGLVIGREGFPLAHEIFAGNVQDRKTLGIMLDRLKTRVGLAPGATVVVDRGMAYADNLQEIRDRGLHYVVAARSARNRNSAFWPTWKNSVSGLPRDGWCVRWPSARRSDGSRNAIPGSPDITNSPTMPPDGNSGVSRTKRRKPRPSASTAVTCYARIARISPLRKRGSCTSR